MNSMIYILKEKCNYAMICHRNMRFSLYRMPRYAILHIGAFLFSSPPNIAVNLQCERETTPFTSAH